MLTSKFLAELKNGSETNVIIDLALDGGGTRFGFHGGAIRNLKYFFADGAWQADGSLMAAGSTELPNVIPCLKSVSSIQNKLDTQAGWATRGSITFTISGRDYIKSLVANNYLKNRRVTYKLGFIASGFTYADYADLYTGIIEDWSRKGDELTITVADDMKAASKQIPVANDTKTQFLDYTNSGTGMHPVDIMQNVLLTQLAIAAAQVDTSTMDSEKATWLNGWLFARVLTEPKAAKDYLNELQQETYSYLFHDGAKISYRVFSPVFPGTTIEEWTDNNHILADSFATKSGYRTDFFNRVVFYYDYDESGSDGEPNFEAAVIAADAASQGATEWNEATTKVIKSKWIRSRSHGQPVNVTGVKNYHASRNNNTGTGTLTYNATNKTLQWTSPGGSIGEAVKVTKDGKFQIFDADKTKWVRVIVTYASLPVGNQTDSISITSLPGSVYATTLATKMLARFRDPLPTVTFQMDINSVVYNSVFLKPTDLKDITTDEALEFGENGWTQERCMVTSFRPDFEKGIVEIEAIDAKMHKRYGFISPAGVPDYPSATTAQRRYAFIGNASNLVNGGTEDGYYMW